MSQLNAKSKHYMGFHGSSDGKESACNAGDPGSIPRLRRKWQPISLFLPGEFHGQRSLVGYSTWDQSWTPLNN